MTLGNLIGIQPLVVVELSEWESADVVRIFPIWDQVVTNRQLQPKTLPLSSYRGLSRHHVYVRKDIVRMSTKTTAKTESNELPIQFGESCAKLRRGEFFQLPRLSTYLYPCSPCSCVPLSSTGSFSILAVSVLVSSSGSVARYLLCPV